MGLQLIAQADSEQVVVRSLGSIAGDSEIFHIEGALWGVSVPTNVLDKLGEQEVRRRLSGLNVFDLYEGTWKYA